MADNREPSDLAEIFRRLIRTGGPISVAQFMGESNARYYASKDPLGLGDGSNGDFVTAPEISQMFGELIGLWLADIWIRSGREQPVAYVELGAGRGTLAKDALRVMDRFGLNAEVHFVEGSEPLGKLQREAVPGAILHGDLSTVPVDCPLLIVGNEFLDALPVRQLVKTPDGWRERMIGLDEADAFRFIAGTQPMDAAVPEQWQDAPPETILETCPGAAATIEEVAGRLYGQGGAALFIDYGYAQPRTGSTLQAVKEHRKVHALAMPGVADLTAHVDFATLATIAQSHEAKWLGTATQGAWLNALGIAERTQALAAKAPVQAQELEVARNRLVADDQMGRLFKVMGLASPSWADGSGFDVGPNE